MTKMVRIKIARIHSEGFDSFITLSVRLFVIGYLSCPHFSLSSLLTDIVASSVVLVGF